jgi:2-polyprenyl-3-methyl-5-hydroxy-6-metoxy-1,4-benzoquinol methylase
LVARYNQMADFYEQRSGKSVSDPATAGLLELAGDVSGLRLLEVACGPGRVARELARRGATLTGVDISATLLAKARAGAGPGRRAASWP